MSPGLDLRELLARRGRDTRFVAGVLAGLLLALTAGYYLIQRGRELPSALVTDRVLLFTLRNLNAVLILVILFVLGRNLFKLWVERRSRLPGTRFRTKLVGTYIGLSLVPVLVLFFYASELLQGAIDRWFSASLANVLEQGNSVSQALRSTIEERNARDAARLVADIEGLDLADADTRASVRDRLEGWRRETGAHYIGVFDQDDFLNAVLDPRTGLVDLPEIGRALPREAAEKGRAVRVVEPPGTRGRLILGAASSSPPTGRRPTVVVVGTLLDPLTSTRSEQLVEAYQTYRQLEIQRGDFKASYLLMFVLVTLLILLASSWMGLYLARRLTEPLEALGVALQRVSTGDLDQRIEVPADDEMKPVVDSFHRMTDELRASRTAIERSNRELLHANAMLDAERAQVAAVVENLAAGVLALDGEGRVVTANSAALQMLRVRASDLLFRTLDEAFADDPREPLARLLAGGPRAEPRGTSTLSFPVAGTWRTFEARVTDLPGAAAGRGGRVLVLDDLTELIRAQKLATWTEAARRVAHEIKNPLTPIRLAAERLLARRRAGAGEEELGELLERSVEVIVREVDNMQLLVDEFSRFARMPAPSFTATRLDSLLEEVVGLYRELKPGVAVSGVVAADVGAVWIDAEQIRRVLINLLDNAVEATEAPGSVAVTVARRDERLELVVVDTGRGIPAADRDKLFLPFFSRKGRGSGMGLAIVQRIVGDHDGTIEVEDNFPTGTLFRVSLPARGAGATGPAGPVR